MRGSRYLREDGDRKDRRTACEVGGRYDSMGTVFGHSATICGGPDVVEHPHEKEEPSNGKSEDIQPVSDGSKRNSDSVQPPSEGVKPSRNSPLMRNND